MGSEPAALETANPGRKTRKTSPAQMVSGNDYFIAGSRNPALQRSKKNR